MRFESIARNIRARESLSVSVVVVVVERSDGRATLSTANLSSYASALGFSRSPMRKFSERIPRLQSYGGFTGWATAFCRVNTVTEGLKVFQK